MDIKLFDGNIIIDGEFRSRVKNVFIYESVIYVFPPFQIGENTMYIIVSYDFNNLITVGDLSNSL